MARETEVAYQSYFQNGERWEDEIVKRALRSRTISWFVTIIFGLISFLLLFALLLLIPLKSFDAYIVEVDKNTGYIEVKTSLTNPLSLTERQAVTQANLVRYIRARESYDPLAVNENFNIAMLLSTGEAARDLDNIYNINNVKNPYKIYGNNKSLSVEVKSVIFSNDNTAIIRFSTIEKDNFQSKIYDYISVVRYRYTNTPQKNEWRFDNPLGFQVYNYRRDQESLPTNGE